MRRDYAKYLAALVLFGTNGIVASGIVLPSYEIVLARMLLAEALLAALCALSRGRARLRLRARECATAGAALPPLVRGRVRDCAFIAASGAAMGAGWMFQYEAYRQVGVGFTSLVYCAGPVAVVALAALLLRERLRPARAAGLAAVLAGVALVNHGAASGAVSAWGTACAAMTAAGYVAMVVCYKKVEQPRGLFDVAAQMAAGLVVVAAFTAAQPGEHLRLAAGDVPAVAVLGLVNTGLGCYLYFSSIGALSAQTVAVCDYLEPASALALAAAVLGERLDALQATGAALILAGALGSEAASWRKGRV